MWPVEIDHGFINMHGFFPCRNLNSNNLALIDPTALENYASLITLWGLSCAQWLYWCNHVQMLYLLVSVLLSLLCSSVLCFVGIVTVLHLCTCQFGLLIRCSAQPHINSFNCPGNLPSTSWQSCQRVFSVLPPNLQTCKSVIAECVKGPVSVVCRLLC